jgi:hypothetical protein
MSLLEHPHYTFRHRSISTQYAPSVSGHKTGTFGRYKRILKLFRDSGGVLTTPTDGTAHFLKSAAKLIKPGKASENKPYFMWATAKQRSICQHWHILPLRACYSGFGSLWRAVVIDKRRWRRPRTVTGMVYEQFRNRRHN